jgi:predicted house-cleaning noncanonical NTP pyrophosphatase (MazG superfamily)
MEFLAAANVRRDMLLEVCAKIGVITQPNLRKDQLRVLIKNSNFPEEEVSEIIEDLLERRQKSRSVDRDSEGSTTASSGGNSRRIKISDLLKEFKEGADFVLFLVNFERTCVLHKIEKAHWVSHLLGLLPLEANETVARLEENVAFNFDVVKEALMAKYRLNSEQLRKKFRTQRRQNTETYAELAYKINTTMSAWLDSCDATNFEKVKQAFAIEQFKEALPEKIRLWLSDLVDDKSFDSLENLASVVDSYVSKHGNLDTAASLPNFRASERSLLRQPNRLNRQNSHEKPLVDAYPKTRAKSLHARDNRFSERQNFDQRAEVKCYSCHQTGHFARFCPQTSSGVTRAEPVNKT